MLWRGRNALTFGRGTTCSLAIILPLWGPRGITSWSLLTLTCSGNGESLQTAFHLHILAEGGDVIYGRIVDIMLEPAEASWLQSVSLCP